MLETGVLFSAREKLHKSSTRLVLPLIHLISGDTDLLVGVGGDAPLCWGCSSQSCCAGGAERWSFPACDRAETREGLAHIQLLAANFRYNQLSITYRELNCPRLPPALLAVVQCCGGWCRGQGSSCHPWLLLQRNHLWHFPQQKAPSLVTSSCVQVLSHPCFSSAWIRELVSPAPGSALAEDSLLFSASSADPTVYSYISQTAFGESCPPFQCQLTARTSNHQFR